MNINSAAAIHLAQKVRDYIGLIHAALIVCPQTAMLLGEIMTGT